MTFSSFPAYPVILIIFLAGQGYGTILQNGKTTSGTLFCIGDNVTIIYKSNTSIIAHQWTVEFLLNETLMLGSSDELLDLTERGFHADYNMTTHETRLSFIVDEFINGANITFGVSMGTIFLFVPIIVYTYPTITATPNAMLNSFIVRIAPTDPDGTCIIAYNVTLTGGSSRLLVTIPANTTTFDAAIVFMTSLNLCGNEFSFEAVASSGGYIGHTYGYVPLRDLPSITITLNNSYFIVNIPGVLTNCTTALMFHFQEQSGTLSPGRRMWPLDMLDKSSCTNGTLIINPVIFERSRDFLGASLQICEPSAAKLAMISMSYSGIVAGILLAMV